MRSSSGSMRASYVMKAMDLKQRMGALKGEEKERYEQQFVPKLMKPEDAETCIKVGGRRKNHAELALASGGAPDDREHSDQV